MLAEVEFLSGPVEQMEVVGALRSLERAARLLLEATSKNFDGRLARLERAIARAQGILERV